ncbi:MAG: amino acid ABC transporter permease [Desulfuromonadia bacterium]
MMSYGTILRRIGAVATVVILVGGLFSFSFSRLTYGFNWSGVWEYRQKFIDGWVTTLLVSAASLVLSLFFGLCAALARRSRVAILRYLAIVYVESIRGTPLLVQILIFFYVVADSFGLSNRYLVGVSTLSLFSGAYLAEMIRGAIESVGRSQRETAMALGLTPFQIYRLVIFPQVLRQLLPPLAGQFASIIKDSSLLSIIAINEFTLNAQEVNAYTYSTLESYLPLAVGYLILTLPISLLSKRLERTFGYAT